MKAQKEKLEGILGTKIAGHRNHVLRFRVPDSWIAHEQAGFSYDATLGFADHEGFRGGNAFPFHPYHVGEERSMDLLEIPLALMDVTIHKYRRLRGERAWEAISKVLEETRGVGGLATLLWHNDTFHDPDYPGCGRLYERSLDWLVQSGAWVATCAEVDRWWRARSAVGIEPLPEGQTGWRIEAPQEIEGLTLRVTLPDPAVPLHGSDLCDITRDGPDHLVKLGKLDTGTRIDLYW